MTKTHSLYHFLEDFDTIHQTVSLADSSKFVLLVSKQDTFFLMVFQTLAGNEGITFKLIDQYKFKRTQKVDTISIQETPGSCPVALVAYNGSKLAQVEIGIDSTQ